MFQFGKLVCPAKQSNDSLVKHTSQSMKTNLDLFLSFSCSSAYGCKYNEIYCLIRRHESKLIKKTLKFIFIKKSVCKSENLSF